jgi:hypothetical protein
LGYEDRTHTGAELCSGACRTNPNFDIFALWVQNTKSGIATVPSLAKRNLEPLMSQGFILRFAEQNNKWLDFQLYFCDSGCTNIIPAKGGTPFLPNLFFSL